MHPRRHQQPRARAIRATSFLGAALALGFPAAAQAGPAVTPAEASALGQQAYLYGFPLLEVLRVRRTATSVPCPDGKGNAPVNALSTASGFANPSSRTVVAPNAGAPQLARAAGRRRSSATARTSSSSATCGRSWTA